MENERAIEILDPEHREAYESLEPVNEACRMGVEALRRRVPESPFAAAEPIPAVDLTTTAHRWSVRATGTVKTRRGVGTSGASGA